MVYQEMVYWVERRMQRWIFTQVYALGGIAKKQENQQLPLQHQETKLLHATCNGGTSFSKSLLYPINRRNFISHSPSFLKITPSNPQTRPPNAF